MSYSKSICTFHISKLKENALKRERERRKQIDKDRIQFYQPEAMLKKERKKHHK